MPKEAARIFLEIKRVTLEPLRDINEESAVKEGFREDPVVNRNFMCSVDCLQGSAKGKFALLWNSTIKKTDIEKYGWEANPWVWLYEFEKVEVEG